MKFIFTCRKCEVEDVVKERTKHKLEKMGKFFKNGCEAHITFSKDKHLRFVVEVTIDYKGVFFRSEQMAEEINTAVDLVIDALLRQIKKNKTKLEKRFHSVHPDILEDYKGNGNTEESFEIIKSKKFYVKPMDVEEAILQMNMLGHSFFVFKNIDGENINVIYKRKDGNIGLIEPTNV